MKKRILKDTDTAYKYKSFKTSLAEAAMLENKAVSEKSCFQIKSEFPPIVEISK